MVLFKYFVILATVVDFIGILLDSTQIDLICCLYILIAMQRVIRQSC